MMTGPSPRLAADHTVHVADLTAGIVLTHVVTDDERAAGSLDASFDLAGFHRSDDLTLATGEPIEVDWATPQPPGWTGPDGWLDAYPAGAVLAIEVTPDSVVHITELGAVPATDGVLDERLRVVYDRAVDEPWLPVSGEELVLALVLEDPASFREPGAPLSALVAATGLDRRGNEVAHDDTVWHNVVRLRRLWRVMRTMGDVCAGALKVLHTLDVADQLAGIDMSVFPEIDGPADTATLRALLGDLRDDEVLVTLEDELFADDDLGSRNRAAIFTGALLAAAHRPRDRAIAGLLAALHAERSLEPLVAEQHLHLAHHADPDSVLVTDRLAWYASDRGDAPRATRLWRRLEAPAAVNQDLAAVERFASPSRPRPGRNDACWCGSGRKYKAVPPRLDRPTTAPRAGRMAVPQSGRLPRTPGPRGPRRRAARRLRPRR